MASEAAQQLAARLRRLREATPGLFQKDVAVALGVTPQQVSNWESRTAPQTPPRERLDGYAGLFASARITATRPVRLLQDDQLDAEERTRRGELAAELYWLRDLAIGSAATEHGGSRRGFWEFGDGRRVVIVASKQPDSVISRLGETSVRHPDYSEVLTYGDPDAVLRIYGAIRAANPDSEVVVARHDDLPPNAFADHAVVVGGAEVNRFSEWMSQRMSLPIATSTGGPDIWLNRRFLVREASLSHGDLSALPLERGDDRRGESCVVLRPEVEGEVSISTTIPAEHTGDKAIERARDYPILVRDIALIARQPNPNDGETTNTLIFGLFARGTLGAARVFEDPLRRELNEQFLNDALGHSDRFWTMFWVPCDRGAPQPQDSTPNLSDPGTLILSSFE